MHRKRRNWMEKRFVDRARPTHNTDLTYVFKYVRVWFPYILYSQLTISWLFCHKLFSCGFVACPLSTKRDLVIPLINWHRYETQSTIVLRFAFCLIVVFLLRVFSSHLNLNANTNSLSFASFVYSLLSYYNKIKCWVFASVFCIYKFTSRRVFSPHQFTAHFCTSHEFKSNTLPFSVRCFFLRLVVEDK